MKKRIILLVSLLLYIIIPYIFSQQEETIYSIYPYSYRRYSTSEQDKKEGILLPTYNDLASNPDKGITLEDWEKYYLTKEYFEELDKNKDNIISREELDEDILMGKANIYSQSQDLIVKYCKKDFPNYRKMIKDLKRLGYRNIDKSVEYVINKEKCFIDGEVPFEIASDFINTNEVATKTYIQLKDGKLIKKKVDLGHFVYLILKEQKENSSLSLYIVFIIIIASIISVTFLYPYIAK